MSTARSNNWSVTINNPVDSDYEEMERARQKGWKVMGQLEKGKEGTPHLQLHVQTPQIRFSAVKKAFPRAHIEVARNVQALANYVEKEETRVASLPSQQEMYPSLSKFWHLVLRYIDHRNWLHIDGDKWWKDAFDDMGYRRDFEGYCVSAAAELKAEMALDILESAVGHLISEGYHVEHYLSPPNRYAFKKFHFSILTRARREIDAQTSRQTDTRLAPGFNPSDNEHNHAPLSDQADHQEANLPTSCSSDASPCSSAPPSPH